ncbi:hypothetical protein M2226_004801 [Bradyrhizobium elkanii]|nr:hypothetical protein [Bradyrhizobium elkanii]
MQRPPRDIAPSDQTLTPYDREHAVTYSTHPTGLTITHIFESEFCCSRCDIDEAR